MGVSIYIRLDAAEFGGGVTFLGLGCAGWVAGVTIGCGGG